MPHHVSSHFSSRPDCASANSRRQSPLHWHRVQQRVGPRLQGGRGCIWRRCFWPLLKCRHGEVARQHPRRYYEAQLQVLRRAPREEENSPHLGPKEKATGPEKYSHALQAPSELHVKEIKATYGPNQKSTSASSKTGSFTRRSPPERASAILPREVANAIRTSEPMAMVKRIAESGAKKFHAKKIAHSSAQCGISRLLS